MNQLDVNLTGVELRSGHDGLLRGHPEPVILWAALALVPSGAGLLQVVRRELKASGGYPCRVPIANPALLQVKLPPGCARLLLLGLAFEEDNGADVKRLGAELANTGQWSVRAGDSRMAAPFRLHELALMPVHEPPDAHAVRLSLHDEDVADLCHGDDWVGGSMVLLPGDRGVTRWSMRFTSDDRRNDWLAQLAVRIS